MKKEMALDQILQLLRMRGVISTGELTRELGVNRSTLTRRLKGVMPDIVRIGNTRKSSLGLLRTIPTLGNEVPLFRINQNGQMTPQGKLLIFHPRQYIVWPKTEIFNALPPEISDMAPQGFMGRALVRRHALELNLPERLQNWSDDHVLIFISKRGEDLPGNLIVGTESARRWMNTKTTSTNRRSYPDLANLALEGQPVGSSAGGEQPKFSAFVDGKYKIIKFSPHSNSPIDKRWRDLLICEHISLGCLQQLGVEACKTSLHETKAFTFLEADRFDRIGLRGRRSVLSLSAVDGFLFGGRDSWSATAQRLERSHLISSDEVRKIKKLEAYCILTGDTDRHFYNLALFPKTNSEGGFELKRFELAPAFDKLPMFFAPTERRILDREFPTPIPNSEIIEVWNEVTDLAMEFWCHVSKDLRISANFRQIAKTCLKKLMR